MEKQNTSVSPFYLGQEVVLPFDSVVANKDEIGVILNIKEDLISVSFSGRCPTPIHKENLKEYKPCQTGDKLVLNTGILIVFNREFVSLKNGMEFSLVHYDEYSHYATCRVICKYKEATVLPPGQILKINKTFLSNVSNIQRREKNYTIKRNTNILVKIIGDNNHLYKVLESFFCKYDNTEMFVIQSVSNSDYITFARQEDIRVEIKQEVGTVTKALSDNYVEVSLTGKKTQEESVPSFSVGDTVFYKNRYHYINLRGPNYLILSETTNKRTKGGDDITVHASDYHQIRKVSSGQFDLLDDAQVFYADTRLEEGSLSRFLFVKKDKKAIRLDDFKEIAVEEISDIKICHHIGYNFGNSSDY